MTLNVEEMILLQQAEHSDRKAALQGLIGSMKLTQDADLLSLYKQLGGKLYAMSDQEFAAIDFSVYEGDDDEE